MPTVETLEAERKEKLLDIGKSGGAVAVAKIINADNDAHGLSESAYTALLTEHAKRLYPDKTPDAAFAKLFSDSGADGVALRKAHAVVVKAGPFNVVPVVVSGEPNRGGDVNPSNPEAALAAYNELLGKAAAYRKANPALSEAQAFSAVFTSKENAKLAALAHQRPGPRTSFEFPR